MKNGKALRAALAAGRALPDIVPVSLNGENESGRVSAAYGIELGSAAAFDL